MDSFQQNRSLEIIRIEMITTKKAKQSVTEKRERKKIVWFSNIGKILGYHYYHQTREKKIIEYSIFETAFNLQVQREFKRVKEKKGEQKEETEKDSSFSFAVLG